ncbi:MAG: nickel-dependent lactate racemase [Candidatus Aminicenantales bacterium]
MKKTDAPVLPGGWRKIAIEFSGGPLIVHVPPDCAELAMAKAEVLADPAAAVRAAYERPIAGPRLAEIVRAKRKPAASLRAAITVSDITRPVPYRGRQGILSPLLETLLGLGLRRENIRIIVGTGTHRASTTAEKLSMFGREVVSAYAILDHDCTDAAGLVSIGRTEGGTDVRVNRAFHEADLKIATGLTESHFMAGASGGRKAVCPGLVDLKTIQKFHSPEFLENPRATNLVLDGNPCHEEARCVAQMVGLDFAVTVTMDRAMRLTGVFAGEMDAVLEAAVARIKTYTAIPIEKPFDIVLTHGGYVGRNHYQTAKAAVGAIPAVREKGVIIIAADNRDEEPIGGSEYKSLCHLLKLQGPDGYLDMLKAPSWRFTKDQWEPEVWGKVLRRVGEKGLIYCGPDIPGESCFRLPGRSGYEFLPPAARRLGRVRKAELMIQNALIASYRALVSSGVKPRVAFIPEGPYAVPVSTRE